MRNVHPSIKGWFELRQADKEGINCVEFIQRKDVRYSAKYLATAIIMRIKLIAVKRIKRALYKKPI